MKTLLTNPQTHRLLPPGTLWSSFGTFLQKDMNRLNTPFLTVNQTEYFGNYWLSWTKFAHYHIISQSKTMQKMRNRDCLLWFTVADITPKNSLVHYHALLFIPIRYDNDKTTENLCQLWNIYTNQTKVDNKKPALFKPLSDDMTGEDITNQKLQYMLNKYKTENLTYFTLNNDIENGYYID